MGIDHSVCNFDDSHYTFFGYEPNVIVESVFASNNVKEINVFIRSLPDEKMLFSHLIIEVLELKNEDLDIDML